MAVSVSAAARTGAGSGAGAAGCSSTSTTTATTSSVASARRARARAPSSSSAAAPAAPAATSAPAPIIPYQSRQLAKASGQDATLRSALAFVVLRRRLAARAAAASPAAAAAAATNNGVAGGVDVTAGPGRKRSRGDDTNHRRRGKTLAPASSAPAPVVSLPRRPIVPDKSHVSHLVRLAITTALPLGDDILGIGPGAGGGGAAGGGAASGGGRRGPIVYDHRLASSRGIGGAGTAATASATARLLAVLDGLLTHLSAQLAIVARASPGDARAIIRREFLDILLVKADAFEYRSSRSGNSGGGDNYDDGRLIFCSEEEDDDDDNYVYDSEGNDNPTAASTRLLFDRTKLVLAVCTVLHRLIVCGADSETIPAAIVGAASSYLRYVYDGSYPVGFDVGADGNTCNDGANANGVGAGGRSRKKVGFQEDDSDDEDDEEDDDEFATITAQVISLPRIGDTVAVNLLILLEEVGLTTHFRSHHGRPVSSSGSVILGALRDGFGPDLTLSPPLTVTSDAAMFVREEELRIVAEIRRRKRRMKKKRGAAGAGTGAVAMGAESGKVAYVPLLDPGAKLMLRLSLWDLVEKLSA